MPADESAGISLFGVASLTPGTCRERLWLLPSGPDQVHHAAMRGDPPRRILSASASLAAATLEIAPEAIDPGSAGRVVVAAQAEIHPMARQAQ